MDDIIKDHIFKKGVWIKEQQGSLTIGSLDKNDKSVMVISDKLSSKIFEFENDMIDALYGEDKVLFNSSVLDIEKLLENIEKQFKKHNLRISFSGTKDYIFKANYDQIYSIIERLVLSSIPDSTQAQDSPLIYINTTVLQDHLCIIYRDSDSISDPSKLKNEIQIIKTVLNGQVSFKATSESQSYYDIMIPSNPDVS
ncbi:MAG: hypothetical protein GY699_16770 [Desulfobacteraceae bacterium]|nr:hypothetical protein [Desulfobacteraceae bacterium]